MTVSDQSTTTGFSESLPTVQHQTSDNSALSGVPSGEAPGRTGAQTAHGMHSTVVMRLSCFPQRQDLGCPTLFRQKEDDLLPQDY